MKYLVMFDATGQEKIPIIKLVRFLTQIGLKEAKDLTEEQIIPMLGYGDRFTLRLTEVQLGRYYIAGALSRLGNIPPICRVEEIPLPVCVDLSEIPVASR